MIDMEKKEDKGELLDLIREAVQIAMPDLRHYYRMPKKGKIVAAYASDGNYFADVQPLRNDETEDSDEPVISKVEIPVLWGGPDRGVVCPPETGTLCDITYYDGDPNYPRISNFRWQGNNAPKAELKEFVIQLEPGVEIRIDKEKQVITLTPENVNSEAGKNWTIQAGEKATITAGEQVTVKAPLINLVGDVTTCAEDEEICDVRERTHRYHEGSYHLTGPQSIQGDLTVSGTVKASQFEGRVKNCAGCGG